MIKADILHMHMTFIYVLNILHLVMLLWLKAQRYSGSMQMDDDYGYCWSVVNSITQS